MTSDVLLSRWAPRTGTWMTQQLVVGDALDRVIGLPDGDIRDHSEKPPLAAHSGYARPARWDSMSTVLGYPHSLW